ncbi:MAG: hypothetical protein HZA50_06050, partial [Planctomycetes bacterium]|nr:hypothetical protein [Planctomycetota bacterium]
HEVFFAQRANISPKTVGWDIPVFRHVCLWRGRKMGTSLDEWIFPGRCPGLSYCATLWLKKLPTAEKTVICSFDEKGKTVLLALKGQNMKAQGNALGNRSTSIFKP